MTDRLSRQDDARPHQKSDLSYEKAVQVWGFLSLVEEARRLLGLDSRSFEEAASEEGWLFRCTKAGWAILAICELDNSYEPFVMNAIAFDIETAMGTPHESRVRILVPEIPLELGLDTAVALARHLWPRDGVGRWLHVTRGGEPAGVTQLFRIESEEAPARGVTVIQGRGVLALIARGQEQIHLDVTYATTQDVGEAMKRVRQLRSEMGIKSRGSATGTPVRKDEVKAVDAARRRRKGESYVSIGQANGWAIYENDLEMDTCPMAVQYVKAGKEIIDMRDELAKKLSEPEPSPTP